MGSDLHQVRRRVGSVHVAKNPLLRGIQERLSGLPLRGRPLASCWLASDRFKRNDQLVLRHFLIADAKGKDRSLPKSWRR
jgi:hypothetical protein